MRKHVRCLDFTADMMKTIANVWERARTIRLVQFVSDSVSSYLRTNCSLMAAGVALFTMLSVLPLLMLMVSALPPLLHPLWPNYDARAAILRYAQVHFSPVVRRWLQEVLLSLARNNLAVDGFSLLAFVWAASNALSQLHDSFVHIWRDNEAFSQVLSVRSVVVDQVRRRRNAFLVLALGFATFISANVLNVEEVGLQHRLSAEVAALMPTIVTPFLTWLTGILFLALLYRWLIPGQVRWREALIGAVAASTLNLLVKLLVANFVDTTIGAANANVGGPLALMLGVYLVIQNILIGGIVVRQVTRRRI